MKYERTDGITWDDAGDRVVVLDAEGMTIITLNPVGSLLWRQLDGPRAPDELVDHLAGEFADVARPQLAADVDEFVEQLVAEGLVRAVS